MLMMRRATALLGVMIAAIGVGAGTRAQDVPRELPPERRRIGLEELVERLDAEGIVRHEGLRIELRDEAFELEGKAVEAVSCRPLMAEDEDGRYPAMLLIPGYSKTARDYVPLMITLARWGYASLAVTQPGFGRSDGPRDFVGPWTMEVVEAALDRLERLDFVDAEHVGAFGFSRGAMAASLLACRRDELSCAVLGGGIYDLASAYETVEIEGIRANIEAETGGAPPEALRERSSIHDVESLSCPVLILHGGKDVNAPVEQAKRLQARLEALGKPHTLVIYPDREHGIGRENLNEAMEPFLREHLSG